MIKYAIQIPYMDGASLIRASVKAYEIVYDPKATYWNDMTKPTGVTYRLSKGKIVKSKTTLTKWIHYAQPGVTLFDTPEEAINTKLVRLTNTLSSFKPKALKRITLYQNALNYTEALLKDLTTNHPEALL